MSARRSATSSRAAEALEEALMVGNDPRDGRGFGRGVPLVELERAAKDDPIGPREHVARTTGERIADLRLRLENGKLAAGGTQVLIVEQVATPEPGAVEDEVLRQRADFGRSGKLADFDCAAGDLNVADHLSQVAAGLDVHRVVATRPVRRERGFRPPQ